tara:strand:+ start:3603 stop:3794 length:192 start_codon:yes stop_codon:yes gene_type:complete
MKNFPFNFVIFIQSHLLLKWVCGEDGLHMNAVVIWLMRQFKASHSHEFFEHWKFVQSEVFLEQ